MTRPWLILPLLFCFGADCTFASLVTVVNATQSLEDNGSGGAIATVNGAGLGPAGLGGFGTHTGANAHSFLGLSAPPGGPFDFGWLHYDFGSSFSVDRIRLWNYNQQALLARGVRDIDIYVSNDSAAFGDESHSSWSLYGSVDDLPQGPGDLFNAPYGTEYLFSAQAARFFRFDITDNWGNGVNTALGEVQFFGTPVPEPASALLFATTIGICFRRRR